MKQRTIEQERASYALAEIKRIKGQQIDHGEFRSYSRSLPAMIHMNGLGQAMAFFRSKGRSGPHHELYDIVSRWLTRSDQPLGDEGRAVDLLDRIAEAEVDMHLYRVAQAEALALMEWVRKFAVAFLPTEDEKEKKEAEHDAA